MYVINKIIFGYKAGVTKKFERVIKTPVNTVKIGNAR